MDVLMNKKNDFFDVIIIGGGINGAAIARDAALRGLKVALFEKKDFGSGTTQYSTRLIHGGLRYLEQFQFGLVFEALQEREHLLKIAPHLVKPLQFVIPEYKQSRRSFWYLELGMIFYDLLSFLKSLPHHTILWNKRKVLGLEKGLNSKWLKGGVAYFDAQVNFPERLCLAHILDAQKHGAVVRNHCEVKRILVEKERVECVEVFDIKNNTQKKYFAKVIVNASGPWVDQTNDLLARHLKKEIGGTKGSHIVVKPWKNAPVCALYVEAVSDKRPIFIVPWRGYILIGTTDIPYDKNLDSVYPTTSEAEYFITETNHLFPTAALNLKKVIHTYAGVRPLPAVRKEAPGDIPRSHIIIDHTSYGVERYFSIISGKITTHRSLAEEVVDQVMKKLGKKGKCVTDEIATDGGEIDNYDNYLKEKVAFWQKRIDLKEDQIRYLIDIFGTNHAKVLQLSLEDKKLQQRISLHHPDIMAEIIYCLQNELVVTLGDFLQRRTGVGSGEGQGLDCVEEIAIFFKEHFNWSTATMKKEIDKYKKEVRELYTLR